MVYVIIISKELKDKIDTNQYRFWTTSEELQILKFANLVNKKYKIVSIADPKFKNIFDSEPFISITPRKELLQIFYLQCIPKFLKTLKSTSYLLKTEIALLLNCIGGTITDYYKYNKLCNIIGLMDLEKHRLKVNKDIYNLISTYITYPSIGYSETGVPTNGYPTVNHSMDLPVSKGILTLYLENKICVQQTVKTIQELINEYPDHKVHVLSFMKLHSLKLENDIYTTIF